MHILFIGAVLIVLDVFFVPYAFQSLRLDQEGLPALVTLLCEAG